MEVLPSSEYDKVDKQKETQFEVFGPNHEQVTGVLSFTRVLLFMY